MMLILSVLGLVLGAGFWLVVARRSMISEEELDRRLARLRRAELATTDEERDRHEANLNAILNGERLIAAPRPPHRREDVERQASASTRWALWLPRVAVSAGAAGLFTVLWSHDGDPQQIVAYVLAAMVPLVPLVAMFMMFAERHVGCSDRHAELMADLPAHWPAWRRYLFALFVVVRHQGPADQVERVRRTHER